jgi:hypothetical protein
MDKEATTALAVGGVAAAGVGGYLLYRYLSGPPHIEGKPFAHWLGECPNLGYTYSYKSDQNRGPLPCVEVINYCLYRLHYLPKAQARSALYTLATQQAVIQFQQANNLPGTGIVDPTTYAALVAAYDKKVAG